MTPGSAQLVIVVKIDQIGESADQGVGSAACGACIGAVEHFVGAARTQRSERITVESGSSLVATRISLVPVEVGAESHRSHGVWAPH